MRGEAEVLAALPGTQRQLCERTGFLRSKMSKIIQALRDDGDQLHITGWRSEVRAGQYMAIYSAGAGEDAPRPPPRWPDRPPGKARARSSLKPRRDWAVQMLFGAGGA